MACPLDSDSRVTKTSAGSTQLRGPLRAHFSDNGTNIYICLVHTVLRKERPLGGRSVAVFQPPHTATTWCLKRLRIGTLILIGSPVLNIPSFLPSGFLLFYVPWYG